nr:hypothetical protein HK105_006826 [Polyrhizophydium stewartii]
MHPLDLECLTVAERRQMWADAFSVDWSHSLSHLPPLHTAAMPFGNIRSQAMFRRAQEAQYVSPINLLQVAVRRGWGKIVNSDDTDNLQLAAAAAAEGALWLVREILGWEDEPPQVDSRFFRMLAVTLADEQREGVLRYLHARLPAGEAWPEGTFNAAARSGNLKIAKFLVATRPVGCMLRTMREAARGGSVEMVQWLHERFELPITPPVVKYAAYAGQLAVLEYIDREDPFVFDSVRVVALDRTISDWSVLDFLHARGCMANIRSLPRLGIVWNSPEAMAWGVARSGGELIADLLDLSLLLGSSMCAEYIVRAATFEIERSHIQMAIIKRDFRTLAAIVHKSHSLAVTTGEIVASTPHRDIAEWLLFHESRCFSLAALCEAVRHSQLKMLKLLFKLDPFLGEPIDLLHQIASPNIKAAVAEIVREAKKMAQPAPAASVDERFEFRDARIEDVDTIHQLIRELAEFEKLSHVCETNPDLLRRHLFGVGRIEGEVLPARGAQVLLAIERATGTAAGMALFFFNFSTFTSRPGLYLEDLYVREPFRGSGLGKAFFDRLGALANRAGCGRMEWSVLDWNERARGFYKSLGATEMEDWILCRLNREQLATFPRGSAS